MMRTIQSTGAMSAVEKQQALTKLQQMHVAYGAHEKAWDIEYVDSFMQEVRRLCNTTKRKLTM